MTPNPEWKKTACILCSVNCGLEVQTENGHITKIRGDKDHPTSQGYHCQKAVRLDYYQNGKHRLTSPLRRKADGTFEEVTWETAIGEIAAKLKSIRDAHGGPAIAMYGGGGQGNHLNGSYSAALRAACGTKYLYTALAQEKTGGFWVDGRLFGKQQCHPAEDVHNADFLLVIGANPWQSHGFPRARTVLQEFSKDPGKTLVVIDPIRTETAEKADIHLQVRPGGDALLLLAMLGYLVQEGFVDQTFIEEHCAEYAPLEAVLRTVPVDAYCEKAGIEPSVMKDVTRKYAQTERACVRTDLGLEQSLHSTLNLYLSKLLWLLTGHFAKPGTQVFHTSIVPLIGNSKEPQEGGLTTRVTGAKEIGKLFPPNVLPLEIDTEHEDRIRAVWVDSGNPAMTAADSEAYRKAFSKLELLVTIDVAMTETARLSHYVLPAATQFEKWEATFFNFEFPENFFHLRRPIFDPMPGTLPEPEIYRRILVAMGEIPDAFPELEEAARTHVKDPASQALPMAIMKATQENPKMMKYAPAILYGTLGKALPDGAASAALLWMIAQRFVQFNEPAIRRAGIEDEGAGLAEAVFRKMLESPSGMITTKNEYADNWDMIGYGDRKIRLTIPEMLAEIEALESEEADPEYPYVLQAGERRSYNANQIYRTADWRKKDREGALRVHPEDAADIGLEDGGRATVRSRRGAIEVLVSFDDAVHKGFVTLPHGYGFIETNDDGSAGERVGPHINALSTSDHCDAIAKTPFHKYIPVAIVPALVPAK